VVVAAAAIDLLSGLELEFPKADEQRKAELERSRRELEGG